ncbi:MAG TPA: PAS domain S-box protein [Syntrophorhabdaceae bacterium]
MNRFRFDASCLKRLRKRLQREGGFVLLALVIFLCGYLFFSFYGQVKANLIEEYNKRQMVLAKQAARSIEKLMAQHERTLKVLSTDRRIIRLNMEGKEVMETIFRAQGRDVRGVSRIDEYGRIVYTVPYSIGTAGKDISHQPHIRDVLSKREPAVSEVFTAIQGFQTIAYHYPVFDGGRFAGTVGVLIDFDHVSQDFLSGIKVAKTGGAWAINDRGTEIYCPIPGHMGRSLSAASNGSQSMISLAREMMAGKTGTGIYYLHKRDGERMTALKKHVAYAPAAVGAARWSIAVGTPEEEILEDMVLFRNKLLLLFAVLLVGSIIFSYYSFRAGGIIAEEEKRRRAEEALRESEEKYRHIFESSIEGIFQTSPGGRLLMANPALAHMHGYDNPEEMMTSVRHIEDTYVHPELRLPFMQELSEKGEVNQFEVELFRKDGSTFLASFNARAVRDGEGRVVRHEGTAQDITERNEKGRELLQKTALLEAQLNASPDAILVTHKGKRILQNRLFLEKIGAPATITADDEDTSFLEWVTDLTKDPEQFLERVRYLSDHEDETSRDEVELKDGTTVDRYSSPVIGRNGEHFGRLWIFRDVTEKKRAHEELREYQKAMEGSRDIMIVLDRSYRYRAVNQSYLKYRMISREEVIGRRVEEIIGKELFEKVIKTLLEACFKGDVIQIEMKQSYPGMGERDFYATYLPIMGAGEIDRAVLVMHDITDRKRAEEALRESEEKYRSVVESSLMGFYVVQDGVFRFVNRGFCEIFGYEREEIVGRLNPVANAIPEDRHLVEENIKKRLSGEQNFIEYEFRTMKKDGKVINVKVLGGTMVYDGQPAATGTLIDITREKSLEAQLRQSQKMEAIGTLAGGIAHDFNNLLTVLIGYANLLQMRTEASNPLRVYVDRIMTASQKAANLTRGLLAFSRTQPLALEPHDINELIRTAGKLFGRLLTEDIEVKLKLSPEEMIVMADSSQIDQILFNLVTNARDAMTEGGTLSIETKPVTLDKEFVRIHGFDNPGAYALLSVTDTGLGMDEAMKEKIFDPFFTTKAVGRGTGIGLSTVYGIVKQHHGYIYVYSEPEVGTAFHIYLPLSQCPAKEAAGPLPEIKHGTETVLVAEDDQTVRSLLNAVLTGSGYSVIEAIDGEDAIDQFSKSRDIALVILDSVMPRKNGRQAYNEINRRDPSVKVLFTSGYTRDVILDKGIEAKELDFISKPVSPLELLRKVREVLDR